jgi:presenilin-like A22 family membrane protease
MSAVGLAQIVRQDSAVELAWVLVEAASAELAQGILAVVDISVEVAAAVTREAAVAGTDKIQRNVCYRKTY